MAYTWVDRLVARMRFRAAHPFIKPGASVCDLGCGLEAAFLDYAADRIAKGVGLDDQVADGAQGRWRRVHADLQSPLPFADGEFDHVVMLAVLEHLKDPEQLLLEAFRVIAPGGSLIMTWPSSLVDPILSVLHRVRLVSDEMESSEHQKRIPPDTLQRMLRRIGFQRFVHRRFEFGLNNVMAAFR
jgi:ubiquinone/menaquinone biosynthesis C-methylase UbiE